MAGFMERETMENHTKVLQEFVPNLGVELVQLQHPKKTWAIRVHNEPTFHSNYFKIDYEWHRSSSRDPEDFKTTQIPRDAPLTVVLVNILATHLAYWNHLVSGDGNSRLPILPLLEEFGDDKAGMAAGESLKFITAVATGHFDDEPAVCIYAMSVARSLRDGT